MKCGTRGAVQVLCNVNDVESAKQDQTIEALYCMLVTIAIDAIERSKDL